METFTHMTPDGDEVTFAHLSLYDIAGDPSNPKPNGFIPLFRQRLKASFLDNLRTAGAEKGEIIAELEGFDKVWREKPIIDGLLQFLREDKFSKEIVVKRSFEIANGAAPLPLCDQEAISWMLLKPFGIGPAEPAKSADDPEPRMPGETYGDEGDGPNLPNPVVYAQTQTTTGEQTGTPLAVESNTPLAK